MPKVDPTITAVQKVNTAFRQTAAGVKLGRMLFDPQLQDQATPLAIASLFNAAGVPFPKEAKIGLAAAQVVVSGGAFVTNINQGASIKQLITPSLNVAKAVTGLLGTIGLIDSRAPAAQAISLAGSIALVVSTGGLNILADIALLVDLVTAIFAAPDNRPELAVELRKISTGMARAWWNDRQAPQTKAAAQLFQAYQSKKISVFQMLAGVAAKAPDQFLTFFPEYQVFIPPVMIQQCFTSVGQAEYGGFLGIGVVREKMYDTFCFDFETITYNEKFFQNVFLKKYILDPFQPYFQIANTTRSQMRTLGYPENAKKLGVFDHENPVYPRMRLTDLAILSMLPPYTQYLHDDFDVKPYLLANYLTPFEMGYGGLMTNQATQGYYGGYKTVQSSPAITFNGVDYLKSEPSKENLARLTSNLELDRMRELDQKGDIQNLLKLDRAERIITEWGIMPYLPNQMESKLPADYKKAGMNSPQGYRNIENFWAAVSIANMIQKDPYFSNYDLSQVYSVLGAADQIMSKHRTIQWLSIAKKMNAVALENVASFFGTTGDKIKLTPPEEGKPVQVIM